MNINKKAKSCLWAFAVPFFALLGVNIYAVSTYELSVEQNNQCMVINLLKDTKEVGLAKLLYQDQANAKCEIKKQPAEKNKTPRVVQLNKNVPRPSSIKATRKFVNNKFAENGFVVETVGDDAVVKLGLQDDNNTFEAEIDSNGVIKIERGQLEDKFIIRGEYAHVLVPQGKTLKGKNLTLDVHTLLNDGLIQCNKGSFGATYLFENKGTLITEGNCTLRMPKSFFRNTGYEGSGILHVKGTLTFEGDSQSTFDNRAGTVTVDKNAMVEAGRFINERLPKRKEYDKVTTSFQKCVKDDGIEICGKQTCENSHEVKGSKAAIINCYGSFTLVASHGWNKQSVIHANGPINITATSFTNQQRELVTLTCNASLKKLFELTSTLLPASITSNDSIDFLLKGMRYVHVRGVLTGEQAEKLPGLTNNGHIRAKEDVTASVHPNNLKTHAASVINGGKPSVNKPAPTFEYKGEMVSLVPTTIQKALPEAQPSPKNVYFRYVSSVNEVSHPISMNEIVFKQGVLPKLKPTSKFLFSYQLQAQLLTQIMYEQTTAPFLKHVNNDALAQFALLKEMGFLYGLVHGIMRELPNVPKSTVEVFISEYDKQRLKEALRLFADKDQKITLGNLENRLKHIRAGTHILVLPEDKIVSAPQSFLYYDCEKEDIVPFVHISKEDFKDNAHGDGEMRAKNVFLYTPIVFNTGSIVAFNKVEIKALSFKNQRPVLKKINNHTTQDMWGNYHTYQYEIRTPQPGGQVLGFIVEVEVPEADNGSQLAGHKGIQNKGGTIEGTCKVSLITKQGNIENRHVLGTKIVTVGSGFLASASGKPSQSLVHDFHAGQISSSHGDVELVAETGKVLNIASDIIAAKNAKLKGYGDVLLKTLTQPHAALSGSKYDGVTYKEIESEAFTVGLGRVIAHEGNVILKSENIVENEGAYTESGKDTLYDGQKGNKIHAAKATTKATLYEASLWYPHTTDKTVVTEHLIKPEMKAGGKLEFLTKLDNVIEAAIMTETGAIYVTAGRDNILKGGQAKTTTDEHEFSIGISFFGKQALEKIWAGDPNAAVWSLTEEDPLVQSLLALALSAKDGDAAGATSGALVTGFEAARLLINYQAQAKAAGASFSKPGFIGERLGVTDAQGNFSPRVRIRFGYSKTTTDHVHHEQTTIKAETFEAKSGRDTNLEDGIKINAKDVHLEVNGDLKTSPATSTTHTEIRDTGIHGDMTLEGLVAAGVSAGTTSRHEQKHDQAEIKADNAIRVDVVGDYTQRGTTIEGKDTRINVGGDFVGQSVQDTVQEQSRAGEATIGLSGSLSGSYNQGSKNKAQTEQVSGISGIENLEINVNGNIKTQGFLFESENPDSYIKAKSIKPGTLQDCDDINTFGLSGSTTYPNSGPDGIHTVIYPSIGYVGEDGITQTTVSGPIKLETEEPAPDINRDKSQMQIKYQRVVSNIRVVIPLIDVQKLSDTLVDLSYARTLEEHEEIKQELIEIIEKKAKVEKLNENQDINKQEAIQRHEDDVSHPQKEQAISSSNYERDDYDDNSTQEQAEVLSTENAFAQEEKLSKDARTIKDKVSSDSGQVDQDQNNSLLEAKAERPSYVADIIDKDSNTATVKIAMPLEAINLDQLAPFLSPNVLQELEQKQEDLLLNLASRSIYEEGYIHFSIDVDVRGLQASNLTLRHIRDISKHHIEKLFARAKSGARYFYDFSLGFTGGVLEVYAPGFNARVPQSEVECHGQTCGYSFARTLGILEVLAGGLTMGLGTCGESVRDCGPGGAAVGAASAGLAAGGALAYAHGLSVIYVAENKLQKGLMLAGSLQNPSGSDNNANNSGKLSREEQKSDRELIRSKRSLQKRLDEHFKKLADYIQDPYAHDNLGILKNAQTPQKKQEIVLDRIKHLNDEIRAFENKIKEINRILASRGTP